jgi:hypothetical protein
MKGKIKLHQAMKVVRFALKELVAAHTTRVEADAHGMKIHLLVSSL